MYIYVYVCTYIYAYIYIYIGVTLTLLFLSTERTGLLGNNRRRRALPTCFYLFIFIRIIEKVHYDGLTPDSSLVPLSVCVCVCVTC